ncbi:MAG: hypothetical protein NWE98_10785 [Candidatus Bathyarchaeota archaeon]|nr:hypothetical protein [Candidatus Bathyarchaeota archaeon]
MSGKEKIEKEYLQSLMLVERMAQEELAKIKAKAESIKLDAQKIGEAVEAQITQDSAFTRKKKVNTQNK